MNPNADIALRSIGGVSDLNHSTTRARGGLATRLAVLLAMALIAPLAVAQPAPAGPRGLPDFTQLVEKAGPAVVNIRTVEKAKPRSGPQIDENDPFFEFFRRFAPPGHPGFGPPSDSPQ